MTFEPAERIAVFLPNPVGDVVMATPVLGAMRRQWPQSHLTCVARPTGLAVLDGLDWFDDTIADTTSHKFPWTGTAALIAELRRRRVAQAVLLPNSFRTAAVARLAGIRQLAGYNRDGRGWMLTHGLSPRKNERGKFVPVPAVEYYNALGRALGLENLRRRLLLGVGECDARAAEGLLAEADGPGPLVMLNPGAAFGTSKMWELTRWAELADALIERRNARIILNVAPDEQWVAHQIVPVMTHEVRIDFGRRENTLGMLKALARRCDLVITNDTGTRHIAAAFNTPLVTLFGSTDPEWSRIDVPAERIVRHGVWCAPCQKKTCLRAPGPVYHACMSGIEVAEVLAESEASLDEGAIR